MAAAAAVVALAAAVLAVAVAALAAHAPRTAAALALAACAVAPAPTPAVPLLLTPVASLAVPRALAPPPRTLAAPAPALATHLPPAGEVGALGQLPRQLARRLPPQPRRRRQTVPRAMARVGGLHTLRCHQLLLQQQRARLPPQGLLGGTDDRWDTHPKSEGGCSRARMGNTNRCVARTPRRRAALTCAGRRCSDGRHARWHRALRV